MAKYDRFSIHTKAGEENWIEMHLSILFEEEDDAALEIASVVVTLLDEAEKQQRSETVKLIKQ